MSVTYPVITVDGPAASGKSTFARHLAERLGFVFVSSGVMYRGLTWFLLEAKVNVTNAEAIRDTLRSTKIRSDLVNRELQFTINDIDVNEHIRDSSVNQSVSAVSAVAEVRTILVNQQRDLARLASLVMEGRDIGTVVFPESPYKFYLDADPAIRAQRRQKEGELDTISKRDAIDSQRAISPLMCAPDARVYDSGLLSVDEMIEAALVELKERGLTATM